MDKTCKRSKYVIVLSKVRLLPGLLYTFHFRLGTEIFRNKQQTFSKISLVGQPNLAALYTLGPTSTVVVLYKLVLFPLVYRGGSFEE